MKKLLIVIIIVSLIAALVYIMINITDKHVQYIENTNTDIETTSKEMIKKNAYIYVDSVNKSLMASLFEGDIMDGTYKVSGGKIVNTSNSNIFYEISYRGTSPSSESTLVIKNNEVDSATIYMEEEKIEYKK